MYKVSIPVLLHERFCREDALRELKRAGAERVFLGMGELSVNPARDEKMYELMKEVTPYFQENGIEVGAWHWTFWRRDVKEEHAEDYLMVDESGKKKYLADEDNAGFACPASERYVASRMEDLKRIAATGPDIIMFDDDYRFALGGGLGCFCQEHMRIYEKMLGRPVTREELLKEIYADRPNETRSMFLRVLKKNLEDFAYRVREAVDSVNPKIRIGLCSVMSLWDVDGVDSVRIAKILAGNTKPLLRLIGAPYWAVSKAWGNRLQHVIELERMEYSWCDDENMEIMTEGDVYPRPRHRVPANYLEGYDTALRAAGVGDGILKYMLDYTSSMDYETGYIHRHLKHQAVYEAIPGLFGEKKAVGVRVYESMNKFEDADLTGISRPGDYAADMFFSIAARMLSDNTVPITYTGNDGVGIAFGENARHLPAEALENGLILDVRAASILMEQGIDVGLQKIGGKLSNPLLHYVEEKDHTPSYYEEGKELSEYELIVKEGAKVLTWSVDTRGERFPDNAKQYADTILYENNDGQRFLVYGFDAAFVSEGRYRSYCMQHQLYQSIEWLSGKKLPAKCAGNPDLYILCKKDEKGMSVGLWNFFADEVASPVVELDHAYETVEFIHGNGVLKGEKAELSEIPPYGFVMFRVVK